MVDLIQEPAVVNILLSVDDSFSSLVDFSINRSGYSFETKLNHKGSTDTTDITTVDTDLSNGQITISLTKTEITAIGVGTHTWYFHYGNGTIERRAFTGEFKVTEIKT